MLLINVIYLNVYNNQKGLNSIGLVSEHLNESKQCEHSGADWKCMLTTIILGLHFEGGSY